MCLICSALTNMVKEREAKKHQIAEIQMDIFKKRQVTLVCVCVLVKEQRFPAKSNLVSAKLSLAFEIGWCIFE